MRVTPPPTFAAFPAPAPLPPCCLPYPTFLQMRQIPGVGPYTAAAVSSIAFNDPAAAVDGNVIRVVSRLRALRGNPTKMAKTWDRLAAELLHPERPGCHNQVRGQWVFTKAGGPGERGARGVCMCVVHICAHSGCCLSGMFLDCASTAASFCR